MTHSYLLRRFCALVLLTLAVLPFTAPFQTFVAANAGQILPVPVLTSLDADDAGAAVAASASGERTRLMIVPSLGGSLRPSTLQAFVLPGRLFRGCPSVPLQAVLRL